MTIKVTEHWGFFTSRDGYQCRSAEREIDPRQVVGFKRYTNGLVNLTMSDGHEMSIAPNPDIESFLAIAEKEQQESQPCTDDPS